jgi:hypothetical protein
LSLLDRATRRFIPDPSQTIVGRPSGKIAAMSFALEFHDSEVRDVVADGAAVRLRFSAASVRGAARERGWLQSVTLTMTPASLSGDTAHAFGKITEGTLHQGGAPVARLEIPATLAGELELALRFANGTLLTLRGQSLTLAVAEGARPAEDLSC